MIDVINKNRLSSVLFELRNGKSISDDDSIFVTLGGNETLTAKVIYAVKNGANFDDLKGIVESDAVCYKILSIVKLKQDIKKYEIETALNSLNDFAKLAAFGVFAKSKNIELPDLGTYLSVLRADTGIVNCLLDYQSTNA